MTVAQAIRAAATELASTSDTARLDAELLMAHALDCLRSDMLLRQMAEESPAGFAALVARRVQHEPVAYIIGGQEFYGLDLQVTPDVLIPRGDSETLIDAARDLFANHPPKRILDLGTGSGALLLAALDLWPEARGIGIDASVNAVQIASGNARVLAAPDRARFVHASWNGTGWADGLGAFDLILCNPPYVEDAAQLEPSVRDWEPVSALFAGAEGLDDYRTIIPQLSVLLAASGTVILEIGATQADGVSAIADGAGFTAILHRDLAGRPRALALKPKPPA